jgi:hypothetical protein
MPLYRLQQTIATADNTAANYATNTYHFIGDDDTVLPALATAVQAVYSSMRLQMSNLVRQNNHEYKIYDMSDPEPRAPLLEGSWNFSAAITNNPLPPECTICLSFQGSKISGVPQARRRGRVYLPFLQLSGSGADGRPTAAVITAAVNAGTGLLTASNAAADWSWIVASSFDPLDGAIVQNGWVDNEWDTQRRRGRVATSRSVY